MNPEEIATLVAVAGGLTSAIGAFVTFVLAKLRSRKVPTPQDETAIAKEEVDELSSTLRRMQIARNDPELLQSSLAELAKIRLLIEQNGLTDEDATDPKVQSIVDLRKDLSE